jgi:hypothetical protein
MIVTGIKAQNLFTAGIEFAPGCVMMRLAIESLNLDHTYQRPKVVATVNRIARHFNEKAIGIISVGQRATNGKYYILDGQNRVEAIKKRLADEDDAPTHVLCKVYLNTTRKKEAELFVELNTNKPVTGNNRFHARLVHKGKPEWIINKTIEDKGFSLSFLPPTKMNSSDNPENGIIAPYQLLRLYNDCPNYLGAAIDFLKLLFDNKPKNVPASVRHGYVLYGIALFLQEQGSKNVRPIANTFIERDYDIAGRWKKIKSGSSNAYGHDKAQMLANWLTACCANGEESTRAAAA